jgi:hypothetical protein
MDVRPTWTADDVYMTCTFAIVMNRQPFSRVSKRSRNQHRPRTKHTLARLLRKLTPPPAKTKDRPEFCCALRQQAVCASVHSVVRHSLCHTAEHRHQRTSSQLLNLASLACLSRFNTTSNLPARANKCFQPIGRRYIILLEMGLFYIVSGRPGTKESSFGGAAATHTSITLLAIPTYLLASFAFRQAGKSYSYVYRIDRD